VLAEARGQSVRRGWAGEPARDALQFFDVGVEGAPPLRVCLIQVSRRASERPGDEVLVIEA